MKYIGSKVLESENLILRPTKEEDLKVIWERYYRVDKAHKRSSKGSGLGLSIVKGILECHKFKYGVSSKVGEGSTFWFEMPIYKEKE